MRTDRRVAFVDLNGTCLRGSLNYLAVVDESLAAGTIETLEQLQHTVIFHTVGGSCITTHGGVSAEQHRGSVTIMAPAHGLRHVVQPDHAWRSRYLVFSGPITDTVPEILGRRSLAAYAHAPAAWQAHIDDAVHAGLMRPRAWDWRILRGISAVLHEMVLHPSALGESEPIAERVARLLDADVERRWSLADIASALSMGRSTLCAAFARDHGTPLAQWIRERRLASASTLLQQGLAVAKVADLLGFSNPFDFSRAYRRTHGRPPSADLHIHRTGPYAKQRR